VRGRGLREGWGWRGCWRGEFVGYSVCRCCQGRRSCRPRLLGSGRNPYCFLVIRGKWEDAALCDEGWEGGRCTLYKKQAIPASSTAAARIMSVGSALRNLHRGYKLTNNIHSVTHHTASVCSSITPCGHATPKSQLSRRASWSLVSSSLVSSSSAEYI